MSNLTNNERNLAEKLNDEMRSAVLPVTVFVGIEAVFAFCGNLLILYVFLFHYHKCNYKYFVLCLSFIDTTSTLTTLPGEIVTQTFWFVYPFPLVCKIKSFFNVFTVCGEAFGLLLIAVDRYRKVCRPLQWQIKPKVAMILIFILLTIACIISIPVAFFWGTHSSQKEYDGYNITVTVCEIDAKYLDTDHPLEYTNVISALLGIVMFVLFILYVFVVRKLFQMRANKKKREYTVNNSKRARFTRPTLSDGASSDDYISNKCASVEIQDTADSNLSNSADITDAETSNTNPVLGSKYQTTATPSTATAKRPTYKGSLKRPKIRRKTMIMFILTALFIFTTALYLICLSLIADGILESMTSTQKSVYFFFFRLYFINHVINPMLYGALDPKFREVVKQTFQTCTNRLKSAPA